MNVWNLVVVDFEFTTINKHDIVMISEAMSNLIKEAKTIKLKK